MTSGVRGFASTRIPSHPSELCKTSRDTKHFRVAKRSIQNLTHSSNLLSSWQTLLYFICEIPRARKVNQIHWRRINITKKSDEQYFELSMKNEKKKRAQLASYSTKRVKKIMEDFVSEHQRLCSHLYDHGKYGTMQFHKWNTLGNSLRNSGSSQSQYWYAW